MLNQKMYLGIDLGSKTMGLATSQGMFAKGIQTLKFKEGDYETALSLLESIIIKENVFLIVLGYPLHLGGYDSAFSKVVLKFKESLENKYQIKVVLQDERFSTKTAREYMIAADLSRKKQKKMKDQFAAQIILQDYLNKNVIKK